MEIGNWKVCQIKQLVIGLVITASLAIVNYISNEFVVVYVPTFILITSGVFATFMWILKTAPTISDLQKNA
jgi:hypothetical protein